MVWSEVDVLGVTIFMSQDHLFSAVHFARLCHGIEVDGGRKLSSEHRSYATASVLSAVAFLEATVNEIFLQPRLFGMTPALQRLFERLWDYQMANASVLTKYETALLLKGAPEFDRGKQPYQGVDLVIKLRNALMHYKPVWESLNQTQRIEKLLSGKFPPTHWKNRPKSIFRIGV
jgi:hypothetical protein